ncbi:MAG: hypothetical protein IKP91_09735 [Bacteroidaceae bacterium]|nr:hypothetical protein [Bacteroidaceae bacterium]
MKKVFLLAVAAVIATVCVNAQNGYDDTKSEVAVSYGLLANSQWLDAFTAVVTEEAGAVLSNEQFLGPLSIEYFYHYRSWLSFGGALVYGQSSMDVANQQEGPKVGTSKIQYLSLMPAMKFDWLRFSHFGMYSKLAAGYTMRLQHYIYTDGRPQENENIFHPNFQISLLGIEAGSPRFRVYFEGGIGEQGVLLAGLRYKF